jgi:hypothetical protein
VTGIFGYVLTSLFWSVVGAGVGYRYGAMSRDINAMKEKLRMDNPDPTTESPTTRRHRLGKPSFTQIIGAIAVIMAVVSTIAAATYSHRLNAVSKCLTSYVADYNAVLRDRDTLGDASRNNLREFVSATRDMVVGITKIAPTPGEPPTTAQRGQVLNLLTHFSDQADATIISLDQSSQARKRYPLPANTCAEQLPHP